MLRVLALSFVCLALARPQLVGPPRGDKATGIDIMLALDASGSMRAADFQPKDRMFVAKKSITEFVLSRKSDRLGLVVFAGEAATWTPLTLDYSMLAKMVEEIETGVLGDGTAIGTAIGTALNRLRSSDAQSKVIVLLTDGDNNAGEISPTKAAEFAKELGVKVYTVLIGRGGPVPFPAGKDLFGRVVMRNQVIPINPELLEKIATMTGGAAFSASDKNELDRSLAEILDSLEKSKLEGALGVETYAELFPWSVAAALALLFLELLLRSTRLSRFP
ncbi:MAG: VWA domain-containing protein [Deltaproteobacteria bacterium]|nr:VWA domain-containing protein [Deltaproteobacteria bacterium]